MGKLLTGLGIRDIANNLAGFEAENRCTILLRMSQIRRNGAPDLALTAEAVDAASIDTDLKTLASVSATCSAMNVQSLEGALIQLLYRLDAEIVRRELALEGTDS